MTNTIAVDHDYCQAHGRCYALFPDLFDPDSEGRGQVKLNGKVADSNSVDEVLAVCPEGAITVVKAGFEND